MNTYLSIALYVTVGVVIGYVIAKTDFTFISNIVPGTCTYKGQTYKNGESFMDDCNTCGCNGGQVNCTLMGCTP